MDPHSKTILSKLFDLSTVLGRPDVLANHNLEAKGRVGGRGSGRGRERESGVLEVLHGF